MKRKYYIIDVTKLSNANLDKVLGMCIGDPYERTTSLDMNKIALKITEDTIANSSGHAVGFLNSPFTTEYDSLEAWKIAMNKAEWQQINDLEL